MREDDSPEVKDTYWAARNFPKIDVELIPEYFRLGHLSKLPGARLMDYSIYYGSNLPEGTAGSFDKEESFAWMFACFSRDTTPLISYHWKPYQSKKENEKPRTEQEKEFWKEVKRMICLRRENQELTHGSMEFEGISVDKSGILAFARRYKSALTVVLVNFNSEEVSTWVKISKPRSLELELDRMYTLQDLLGKYKFPKREWSGRELKKGVQVTIPCYRAVLTKIQKK